MFGNTMGSFLTFQSDDDDGGNVTVGDERSSFDFKYDDDDNVNCHLKMKVSWQFSHMLSTILKLD